MKTTIVIPTYNERDNLEHLVDRIGACAIPNLDVLIVDDASPDGTGVLADDLSVRYANIRVLHREKKEGLGAAYVAGFRAALDRSPDVIVQMDADGSHDTTEIPNMLARIDTGADLIIGSRRVRGGSTQGWGLHRHVASRTAQWFTRALLGIQTKDVTSGFRAWRAELLRDVLQGDAPAKGYAFQETMLLRAERIAAAIVEHPITFRDRTRGQSKLGIADMIEFPRTVLTHWWRDGKLPHPDGIVTFFRLPHAERRLTFILAALVIVLTGLPLLLGWWWNGPNSVVLGTSTMTTGDTNVYYSYIEQVREGNTMMQNLYSPEQNVGTAFHLEWYAVGLVARMTGWSTPVTFHAVRLALILPFLMLLATFIATFIRKDECGIRASILRRTALVIAALGGGMGALMSGKIILQAERQISFSHIPMDLWAPELYPLISMMTSPHFILSTMLLLSVYLATVRLDMSRRVRWTTVAALSASLLWSFHPFYLASVPVILLVFVLVRMLRERTFLPHLAHHLFWIGFAALPPLMYWGLLTILDPMFSSFAEQNALFTGPLSAFVWSYGALLPFATIGAVLLARRRKDPRAIFLVTWITTNTLLLYAPVIWQRRFIQALSIGLIIAGAVGAAALIAWIKPRLPKPLRESIFSVPVFLVLGFLLFGFTSVINLARNIIIMHPKTNEQTSQQTYVVPLATIDAARWMKQNTDTQARVLALGFTANMIPAWGLRTVYAGHGIQTSRMIERVNDIRSFVHPKTPPRARRNFLVSSGISHIFSNSSEPSDDLLREAARELDLPVIYANDNVTIYRVPEWDAQNSVVRNHDGSS